MKSSIVLFILALLTLTAMSYGSSGNSNCPAGEHFDECGETSEPLCFKDPNTPVLRYQSCNAACFCNAGLIRQKPGGVCIPYELC
ncbi:chymotrypsin inhibitor Ani s 6-like [Anopheles funestus]|uniref:chymotrypsin inhibitor Ani s 6-like n=1 Tax=Anopheles funestus TaxID=62324 RepID=UPI0020C60301|nr:chymotrypsin inhibitor Ani s 6-like [Anopheles funestus]